MADNAKQEITEFLQSDSPGIITTFSKASLTRAAETLFTAQGKTCPVAIIARNGNTYLINRDHVRQ